MSATFNDFVKQMQNNGCDYCEGGKMFFFKFIEGTNTERAVFINEKLALEMAICYEEWETEDIIKINYCPMCGKQLENAAMLTKNKIICLHNKRKC